MAERGDGRARRRRTSANVQWTKVHGHHLSIPIEWLDKRGHDHVTPACAYRVGKARRAMATIASAVNIVSLVKTYLRGLARWRSPLMRWDKKEDKISLAEGLSNGRVPRCATTAFTASNRALR